MSSLLPVICRLTAVVVTMMLAACAGDGEPTRDAGGRSVSVPTIDTRVEVTRTVGERAAIYAVRQLGVPYRYGGSTERGFDCSGLVQFAYAKAGKQIPRTTAAQWEGIPAVSAHNLQIGDVLFFRIDGTISHVGLYLGGRRFVHAPSSGREVTIAELESAYYRKTFVRGGRPR